MGNASFEGRVNWAIGKDNTQRLHILRAVTLRTGKVDKLVNDILTLVHLILIAEYLGKLDGCRLILLQVFGAELFVQLDETLPRLWVFGLYAGGGFIRLLGTEIVAFAIRSERKKNMAGGRLAGKDAQRAKYARGLVWDRG